MPPLDASGPNAAQIDYWNTATGRKWVDLQDMLDSQLRSFGQAAARAAAIADGDRVLDVGCGCGTTTIEIAHMVGAGGRAVGIDVSGVMLEQAAATAARLGLDNVRFENVDAQTHRFDPASFDVLYSRFGVMFFSDPEAAFANLRLALAPGGRVAFVCWQPAAENPWMLLPTMAAMQHITLDIPADPHAPGPFAFGDEQRVASILSAAGFVDTKLEALNQELSVGGDSNLSLDEAVGFMLQLGPAGKALREADEATRRKVAQAVRESMAPYQSGNGVRMPSAAWIVRATNP